MGRNGELQVPVSRPAGVRSLSHRCVLGGAAAYERSLFSTSWPRSRDPGIHINVETHEEITTFEVVRLVEAVGPDVMCVTFEIANVIQRGESPVMAAQRVAPYVRQTHLKDVVMVFVADGVQKQQRPCGEGLIDYDAILPLLARFCPTLNLSIENPNERSLSTLRFFRSSVACIACRPDDGRGGGLRAAGQHLRATY